MSVILQVNGHWDFTEEDIQALDEEAKQLEFLPGLQWKVWIGNKETKTTGGIYLFDTWEHAQEWQKLVVPKLSAKEGVTDVTAQLFNVIEIPSRTTRAPLDVPVPDNQKQ